MGNSSADKKFVVTKPTPEQLEEWKKINEDYRKRFNFSHESDPDPKHADYRSACGGLENGSYAIKEKKLFRKLLPEKAEELILEAKDKNLPCKKICYRCGKPLLKLEEKDYICSEKDCGITVENINFKNCDRGMSWGAFKRLLPHDYQAEHLKAVQNGDQKEKDNKCNRCGKDVLIVESGVVGGGTNYGYYKTQLCTDQECAFEFFESGEA